MKPLFVLFIILTSPLSWGESLLDNEVLLGPVRQYPSIVKLKVLDSFSGKSKYHGLVVQILAENFWVENETSNLKYSVQVTRADVMKSYSNKNWKSTFPSSSPDDLAAAEFLLALEQAGQEGVKVVNYSVVSYFDSPNKFEYQKIVDTLEKYDMLLVVPAGNQGKNANRYPCAYPHEQIVCVAAGKQSFVQLGLMGDMIVLDKYSNNNTKVKFVANGWLDKTYGTSFASPRVAQALAFLWSYSPNSSAKEVVSQLKSYGRFVDNKSLADKISKQQNPYPFLVTNFSN